MANSAAHLFFERLKSCRVPVRCKINTRVEKNLKRVNNLQFLLELTVHNSLGFQPTHSLKIE